MADGVKMNVHEIDLMIKKLINIGGPNATKCLIDAINDALSEDVYPLWIRNISVDGPTLAELRRLGHPYSTRYGKDSFTQPDFDVNKQSGGLVAGSKLALATVDKPHALISESAPEYIYLRYGTSKMRIRDPGGEAMAEALPKIRARFKTQFPKTMLEVIGRA